MANLAELSSITHRNAGNIPLVIIIECHRITELSVSRLLDISGSTADVEQIKCVRQDVDMSTVVGVQGEERFGKSGWTEWRGEGAVTALLTLVNVPASYLLRISASSTLTSYAAKEE